MVVTILKAFVPSTGKADFSLPNLGMFFEKSYYESAIYVIYYVLPGVEKKISSHTSAYFLLRKTGSLFFLCCLQILIFGLHLPSLLLQTVPSASFSFFCFSALFHFWSSTSMLLKNSRRKLLSLLHHWSLWIQQMRLQLLPTRAQSKWPAQMNI